MKLKAIFTTLIILFCLPMMMAQENKTVKKETTVKKVVTKQGGKVVTKEVSSVKKAKGKLMVEGSDEVNQKAGEAIDIDNKSEVVVDAVTLDAENEAKKKEIERRRQEALKADIEAQK